MIHKATDARAAWLAERNTLIGASESASILGQGYETQEEVWARKIGAELPKKESDRMKIGTILQPALIACAREFMAVEIVEEPDFTIRRSESVPFIGASLDAYVPGEENAPLDVKNVDIQFASDWEGDPPLSYQIQLQQQMFVTGAQHGYLFALIGGNRPVWHRVVRNEKFVTFLIDNLRAFWGLVERRERPASTNAVAASRVISALYPRGSGISIDLRCEAAGKARSRIDKINALMKRLDESKAESQNAIKDMLGTAEFGTLPEGFVSWQTQHRNGYTVQPTSFPVMKFHNKPPKGMNLNALIPTADVAAKSAPMELPEGVEFTGTLPDATPRKASYADIRNRMFDLHPHCRWCGCQLTRTKATLDHLVPLALGGANDESNYVLACAPCNNAKGDSAIDPSCKLTKSKK